MPIRYDPETDTLHIILGPEIGEAFEYEEGPFSALIDDAGCLTQISIREARKFIVRALAAGIEVEGAPDFSASHKEPIWEDVDSSMISAFKYDERAGTLDVAFKRTGVYRYADVPLHVVEGLRNASSKGSYMRAIIIDTYPHEKLKR